MSEPQAVESHGELFFGVDARHIRQLGRELVADRVTAISELIKNAYDADATRVVLSFERASQAPGGTLSILDDGNGMTLEDIKTKWMMISTDSKERSPLSPLYGRRRAGRKGIGRFAAESLGRRLRLDSVARGTALRTRVRFDWEKDFVAGRDLGTIPNLFTTEPSIAETHETLLTIEGLYSSWTADVVRDVQRAIMFLQPPFPVASVATERSDHDWIPDPGFGVDLVFDGATESASASGLSELFDSATAVITAEIDSEGNAVRRVLGARMELDDAEIVEERYPRVGALQLKAHYFIYTRNALGSIKARVAQQMGFEFGGVRVYRDGLRILPYGERRDDWLGLDEQYRRRSILFPIGNINFFGEVHISRASNPGLVDTASREGIVENEAFIDLRRFVFDTLVWGAQRVASVRKKKETASKAPAKPATRADIINRALHSARAVLQDAADPTVMEAVTSALERLKDEAQEADAAERATEARLAGEMELLRILASLGTSIAVFSHETRAVVDRVAASLGDLEDQLSGQDVAELEAAQNALATLDDLGRYIDGYVSRARMREKEPQPVADVARAFRDAFESTINGRGVSFTVDIDPPYLRTVHMTRSELESILFNLLTNSIKAMDREGHTERAIHLSGRASGTHVILRFEDTGVGVEVDAQDRIFDPFFTTTRPEDSELGTGTGLGLWIVQDTLVNYGGKIALVPATHPFATCFEIHIPLALGA